MAILNRASMLRRAFPYSIVWGFVFFCAAICHGEVSKEYQIKAAFLFNFCRFVEWPETAFQNTNDPMVIGVLGTDPFGEALDEIVKGESVNGHPVTVARYRSLNELGHCHILFIGKNEESHLAQIFRTMAGSPTLTVSEINNFARDGGIVRLYTGSENKVRLRINVDNARAAGLKISSKLLTVSETISNSSP